MTIGLLFAIVAVLGIAAAVVWNFYPPVREQLKGWTTVIEAGGAFLYWVMGQLTGGLQDAIGAGYVPSWLVGYIPAIMLIWFLLKRFGTTTPVGGAK